MPPIIFFRAPRVAAGQKVTSSQMSGLARAVNARTLSGLGNMHWRLAYFWDKLVTQMRNPSADGFRWAPQGEWWDIYAYLQPESGAEWPITGPGEPEGSNLANVLCQFVFGSPYIYGEADRLSGVPLRLPDGRKPETPWEIHLLSKLQRGLIDPRDGSQIVPALEAAESFLRVVTPPYSSHGKSYGGYAPTPEEGSPPLCRDLSGDAIARNLRLKFTALASDVPTTGLHGDVSTDSRGHPVVTYAGTCPLESQDTGPGHVLGIARLPLAYYLAVNATPIGSPHQVVAVDRFPTAQWIEGPYTGNPVLQHHDGQQLSRLVWWWAAEFRGSQTQRKDDDFDIRQIGFDFETFLTRQYHLAPNLGRRVGNGLEALYPRASISSGAAAGTGISFERERRPVHRYLSGWMMTAVAAEAVGLLDPVTIEVVADGIVVMVLELHPDGGHAASALQTLRQDLAPREITCRLASSLKLAPGGKVAVETTELYPYKPQFWDAYLVLRLMSARN